MAFISLSPATICMIHEYAFYCSPDLVIWKRYLRKEGWSARKRVHGKSSGEAASSVVVQ